MHPRWLRCSALKYDPVFSVVAPCPRGASPVSVQRQTFTTGCEKKLDTFREHSGDFALNRPQTPL
jgi:hypothetical protein